MDPVQWGQAGAALLANEWSNVAEQIGIDELSELAEARPSDIHGTGLFATRDLEMGTLVTLYRPDLTVDDTGKALMIDQADSDYFQDFQMHHLLKRAIHQGLFQLQLFSHFHPHLQQ